MSWHFGKRALSISDRRGHGYTYRLEYIGANPVDIGPEIPGSTLHLYLDLLESFQILLYNCPLMAFIALIKTGLEFLEQDQGEEAAKYMSSYRLVVMVINGPSLKKAFD